MNASLQTLRQTLAANENKGRELQTKLDNLSLVEQDLVNCLKIMDECEHELNVMEKAALKVAEDNDTVERKRTESRELEIKESQTKRQEIASREKLQRQMQQMIMKRDALDVRLNKMREDWDNFEEEHGKNQASVSKFVGTIAETRQKVIALLCFAQS